MNTMYKPLMIIVALLWGATQVDAQETKLSDTYKTEVIETISNELENRYVFQETAKKISNELKALNQQGKFKNAVTTAEFTKQLTEHIYEIGKDKHISVDLIPAKEEQEDEDPSEAWLNSRLEERMYYRRYNANFKSVIKLDSNIGYLDLRGFYGLNYGRDFATYAMAMLATSDAIIIDLRNNSGGRGEMADYLLSYFFEESIVTGVSRKRKGDEFIEQTHRTAVQTEGKVMPNTPLFILTSNTTFSAAEAFSYPLQAYKRATFIGETTKGGANAGDLIPVNDELQIFIPDIAGLPHPETGTTFEGVGIVPDIAIDSEEAYKVAIQEARKAARAFRSEEEEKSRALLNELNETVATFEGNDAQELINIYLKCKAHDLIFESWEIDGVGYHYFQNGDMAKALALFKVNTVLYPYASDTFKHYAEALESNNRLELAVDNYRKAIAVAKPGEVASLQANVDLISKQMENDN